SLPSTLTPSQVTVRKPFDWGAAAVFLLPPIAASKFASADTASTLFPELPPVNGVGVPAVIGLPGDRAASRTNAWLVPVPLTPAGIFSVTITVTVKANGGTVEPDSSGNV